MLGAKPTPTGIKPPIKHKMRVIYAMPPPLKKIKG